jgi:two-component system chemotaxis sensor kinase CheA
VQQDDIVREFLIESTENLNRLDQEILDLERRPKDQQLIGSIFRTVHTVKGSCGFLGFSLLERVAHQAENLLSQVRAGERAADGRLVQVCLAASDTIRKCLLSIESTGSDASVDCAGTIAELQAACDAQQTSAPDTAAVEGAAAPEGERACSIADSSIRIEVGLLDKLMNLVGELVLARNQVLQFTTQNEDVALNATSQRLNLITTELQESVMKTRMQPIGVVWNKLPRLVREVAVLRRKQVRLDMEGSDTELDKTLIEAIKDPITHLVRNCCDHGIEAVEERVRAGKPPQGTVRLKAYHEGGQVNIEISDDGAGVDVARVKQASVEKGLVRAEHVNRMSDREALQLMLLPGVSTAREVTSVSGRGVGMDVVRVNIEKIGGSLDIGSVPGRGTTFKLKIPLTLAIIPGLIVTSGGERFIIPQASLMELIRLDAESAGKIEHVHGTAVYRRRGRLLPITFLNEVLRLPAGAARDAANIVVLQVEHHQFGLVVDGIQDTQEIVVKPLGKQLKGLAVYAGATIMGDGRVALILDVLGIGQRSGVLAERREQSVGNSAPTAQASADRQRLLLFRAGSFERLAVLLGLVARLEEFPRAMIERAGGGRVVQYRGGILNLVSLSALLEPEAPDTAAERDPVQAIVFSDGVRSLGVLVDGIIDIVEDAIAVRQSGKRAGLLGSSVLGGHVTDFLDVRAVLDATAQGWLDPAAHDHVSTVLVAEPSAFVRGLVRSELEMAGYRVIEAGTSGQALKVIADTQIDVVLAAADLPERGFAAVAAELRARQRDGRNVAAIGLAREPMEPVPDGFIECLVSPDRDTMLASLAKLNLAVAAPATAHHVEVSPS